MRWRVHAFGEKHAQDPEAAGARHIGGVRRARLDPARAQPMVILKKLTALYCEHLSAH